MALRAGGGRNRQDVPDEFGDGEEPTRISRVDPTFSDAVDDEDDDGLGSSTVVGVPTPPPRARTAGVGKLEFDDDAVDEVLSAIEEKAAIVPASTPAAPFAAVPQPPSPVTHGGRSSGLIPSDPRAPNQHPSAPYPVAPMGHHPSTPYPPYPAVPYAAPQPYPPAQYPAAPPLGMHTPIPSQIPTGSAPAATKSRAPLFAIVGVGVLLAGGVAAYMLVANHKSTSTEAKSAGSGSAGEVVATGSSDPSGSAGSAGSASVPNGSGDPAGSGGSATGSAGSAAAGSAVPAEPVSVKGELVSVEHPVIEHLAAEVKGEIARVAAPTTRDVKEGDVLFTIKARSGANVGALQKRVSELQALAKEDPDSYAPFLRRARNELRQAQAPVITTVKAGSDGAFQSKVKVGDHVDAGTVLGNFVDARTWIAVGSVEGTTPTASWTCTVADNTHTAACKIQATEVINGGAGTRMTVEISATGTSWLAGPSRPWLVVEPPSH